MKTTLCFFAILAVTLSAVVRPATLLDDPWAVLRCENGSLVGTDEFVGMFKSVMTDCGSVVETSNLFTCIVDDLGITDEDGTPNTDKIHDFYSVAFSRVLLQDLPTLTEDLEKCSQDFIVNYNTPEEGKESAESFFHCFTASLAKHVNAFEDVCKYENAFNSRIRI